MAATQSNSDPSAQSAVTVTAKDLPLHCPMARTPVWSSHPRVYLHPDAHGYVKCPYCGTDYTLQGPAPGGH
jgi:uncharacterized Zn-finger protein